MLKKDQNTGEQPKGSVTGEWRKQEDGSWKFVSGGRTYANECLTYNPYAKEGQEKLPWFHFASDGIRRPAGFSTKRMAVGINFRKTSDGNWGKNGDRMAGKREKMVLPWTDGTNDKGMELDRRKMLLYGPLEKRTYAGGL